eukprot:364812-Chlamydomonas_euryale.AAC.3
MCSGTERATQALLPAEAGWQFGRHLKAAGSWQASKSALRLVSSPARSKVWILTGGTAIGLANKPRNDQAPPCPTLLKRPPAGCLGNRSASFHLQARGSTQGSGHTVVQPKVPGTPWVSPG